VQRRWTACKGHGGKLAHVVHRHGGQDSLEPCHLGPVVAQHVAIQADRVGLGPPDDLALPLTPRQQRGALLFERDPARPGGNARVHVPAVTSSAESSASTFSRSAASGSYAHRRGSQLLACPGKLGLHMLHLQPCALDLHDDLGLGHGEVASVGQAHALQVKPLGFVAELLGAARAWPARPGRPGHCGR